MLRSLPGRFGNSTTSRSSPRPRSSWVKTPAEQHAPVPPQRRTRPDRCATCAVLAPPTREVRCHAPPFNVYRCDSENARNQRTREPVALAMVFCRSAPSSGSHLSGDVQFQGFSRWCSASRVSTRGRGRCCAWRLRRLRNDDPDVLLGAAQTALTSREYNGFPRSTSRAMPTACDVRKCPCARSAVAPRRSDGYCWQETSGPWTLNQCFERYL